MAHRMAHRMAHCMAREWRRRRWRGTGLVALDRAVDVAAHAERGNVGHEVVEPEVEDGQRPQRPRHVTQLERHGWVLRRGEDELVGTNEYPEVA